MSKKTWILISCLVLSLTLGLGGSLAYLTDRDADVNVFTMGNVDIELTEEFQQGAELMPGKDITKDVKVKNTGKNNAWVWVQIALPAELDNTNPSLNVLHFNYSKDSVGDGQWKWVDANDWSQVPTTDINGVNYKVYTVLYQSPLVPGAETPYSAMTKVYMDTSIDVAPDGTLYRVVKGEATKINWNVKDVPYMYVSAYAIQTEGFANVEDAYAAYNKQWTTDGNVNNGLIWGDAENDESGSEEKTFVKMAPVFHSEPTELMVEAEIDYCAYTTDLTACITTTNDYDTVVIVKDGIYRVGNDPDTSVVRTMANSTVKIMDGHFTCSYPENPDAEKQVAMIHAQGGKIEIYGGTFMELEEPAGATETQADFLKADGGTIVVYGGGFCNWDPTAFVAEGYKVDYFEDNKWYWVSKAE